jgi:hypothetical protein
MVVRARSIQVRHAEGVVVVDRWLSLRVPPKAAVLLRQLRQELERCLKAAAENPAEARNDPGAAQVGNNCRAKAQRGMAREKERGTGREQKKRRFAGFESCLFPPSSQRSL